MKRLYFFVMLCIGISSVKAQFTITASYAPVIGDVLRVSIADTTGVVTGTSGPAQTWNYTGLSVSQFSSAVISETYVANTAAINYTKCPSASMASTTDGNYFTMQNRSSGYTIYGITGGQDNIYGDPKTLYSYPFSYGMTNTDTYSLMIVGTQTSVGTVTTTADAWGTLQMPGAKIYTNVLRLKTQSVETATLNTMGAIFNETVVCYNYLSAADKSPILTVSLTSSSIQSGTYTSSATSKSVTASYNIYAGLQENALSIGFSMYPNPADNRNVSMRFILAEADNFTAAFYNSIGQEVKSISFGELPIGPYTVNVDLRDLKSGMYYVKLKGRNGTGTQKLIID